MNKFWLSSLEKYFLRIIRIFGPKAHWKVAVSFWYKILKISNIFQSILDILLGSPHNSPWIFCMKSLNFLYEVFKNIKIKRIPKLPGNLNLSSWPFTRRYFRMFFKYCRFLNNVPEKLCFENPWFISDPEKNWNSDLYILENAWLRSFFAKKSLIMVLIIRGLCVLTYQQDLFEN